MNAPTNPLNKIASEPDDDEVDLVAIIHQLWAGRGLIFACAAAGLSLGLLYSSLSTPVWRADALVQLEKRSSLLALPESFSDLVADASPSTMAEIEIIRSRSVLREAAAQLKLDWSVTPLLVPVVGEAVRNSRLLDLTGEKLSMFPRQDETVDISYLQVKPSWLGDTVRLTVAPEGKYFLELPDQRELTGSVGALTSDVDSNFSIRVSALDAAVGRVFLIRQLPESATVTALASALTVNEQGRQTGILRASMTAGSPSEATRRLDAVLNAYTEKNVAKNAAEAAQSLRFVESQIPIAETEVQKAETQLNDFRAEQNSIDIAFETESLLSEARQLEAELRALGLQEAELAQRFTPSHPVYQQTIETRNSLESRLSVVRTKIDALPDTQRELVNLTRKLDVAQSTFIQLLNRAQELRVIQASQIGNARVVDRAEATDHPIAPRRSLISALAILLGLMSGIGLVIVRNWLKRGVDSPEDIERLGVPVVGITTLATINEAGPRNSIPLVVRDYPDSVDSEAFRSLRTALRFLMADTTKKSLVITSPMPGAGKSFCAANLAVSSAQAGLRVCLVDADLRRGYVATTFDFPTRVGGLAEFLVGDASIDGIIRASGVPSLDVVTTGKRPPNPAELLMGDRFSELCAGLEERYDLVVFDTPPVLLVTDATIIARHIGQTLVVARHAETEPGDIVALLRTLEASGTGVKGAVLNAYDPRNAKPSSYGYSRYGYGYRYSPRTGTAYNYAPRDEAQK